MRYYPFYLQYLTFAGEPSDEGFTACHCPFASSHPKGTDNKPSGGVDLKTGVLRCFTCDENYSPERFLSVYEGISMQEASHRLSEYRKEHNLVEKQAELFVKSRNANPKFEELVKLSKAVDLEKVPMAKDYAEARGLRLEIMKELGVGWLPASKTFWKRDSLVFPYIVEGKVYGIRYRDAEGSKGGEPGCHFTLWGIDDLSPELIPGQDPPDIAILVEGESDRIRTYQALKDLGLSDTYRVVSSPTGTFRYEWVREFEGYYRVVLIPQDDETASQMVGKAQKALQDRVAVCKLPWKRRQTGKDICDWLFHNDLEDFRTALEVLVGDSSRRIMSGESFRKMAKRPRRYLINKLLARRQVGLVVGQPKHRKTWVVLNLIRAAMTGEEFCGIPDTQGIGGVKVLFIEEEGDAEELQERLEMTLHGTSWEQDLILGHHLGVQLDQAAWIEHLEKVIAEKGIDILVLDPLQQMHTLDEDSASDMGVVWNNIHRLTVRFPDLAVIIIHHFNKMGDLTAGWNAIRGSSRHAAAADLAIFVEKRPSGEPQGVRVKFDGRTLKDIETPDGKEIFKLAFQPDGTFRMDTTNVAVSKQHALYEELRYRGGSWELGDCAKHFGVSTVTVRNWVDKLKGLVEIAPTAPGKPSILTLPKD